MSFKITYGDLRDHNFNRGFQKLANHNGFKDAKVIVAVARIGKLFKKRSEDVQEAFLKLLKSYAILDDKGEFIPMKDEKGVEQKGTFQMKPENIGEVWEKAQDEFNKSEIEIFANKLQLHDIVGVGLTPLELGALEGVIKGVTEDEPVAVPGKIAAAPEATAPH